MNKVQSLYKYVTCNRCNGSGILTKKCRGCNGTGKVKGETCNICKGSGIYKFHANKRRKEDLKCDRCNGSGKVRIKVKRYSYAPEKTKKRVQSFSNKKRRQRAPMNPVISKSLGMALKQSLYSV